MENITAIIETPRGKGYKIDFDPAEGHYKLKKVMPAGLVFPFDFGYIPGTAGGDGDPLDVLIISEIETFTGCAMDCRIIGALKVMQQEKNGERMRNDRLIAVPAVSVQYAHIKALNQLPPDILKQIESFFSNYNQQAGKVFKVLARLSAKEGHKLIRDARNEEQQTRLFQLLVPQYRKNGKKFPDQYYTALNKELIGKFGGLTVYSRGPAEGFWKKNEAKTIQEAMLVYEVMADEVDKDFWHKIKGSLAKKFDQEELVLICSKITRI
jgi:inorganic pyrophosphatase